MAVEVQFTEAAFHRMIAEAVQEQLYRTCVPGGAGPLVDHLDVGAAPIAIAAGDKAGTVAIRLPVDVFAVTQDELRAAPNATPAAALAPRDTMTVVLALTVQGTAVTIRAARREPSGLDAIPGLGPVADALVGSLPPVERDLGELFDGLSLPRPAGSAAEAGAGVVALRFDAAGPLANRLAPGQEWGVFLDGAAVVSLVAARIAATPAAQSAQLTPRWAPQDATPAVVIDFSRKFDVPDPFSAAVSGSVTTTLTLPASPRPALLLGVSWSFGLHVAGLPGFAETVAENLAKPFVAQLVGQEAGLRLTGPTSGEREQPLPRLDFAGARLSYGSLVATAEGMTLGGATRVMPAPRDTLSITPLPFGVPSILVFCSQQAKTGSDRPPRTVSADAQSVSGGVTFSNHGRYCGVEMGEVPPGLLRFLNQPPPGDTESVGTVAFRMSARAAAAVDRDVNFTLRTARGVRRVELGQPQVVIDAEGNVANVRIDFIPDCLHIPPGRDFGASWGLDGEQVVDPGRFRPPPFEDPSWSRVLSEAGGVVVQLVTLDGLEPGELLQLRTPFHALDVTAAADGTARVPVILAVGGQVTPATLERVNRKSLAGHVSVQSAAFRPRITLPDAEAFAIGAGEDGRVLLGRREGNTWVADAIALAGPEAVQRLDAEAGQRLAELNPQPLPPAEDSLVKAAGLDGVAEVATIPGFETVGLAVARLADGSAVLLEGGREGARVAGRFEGPMGRVAVAGPVAVTRAGGQLAVMEVIAR
jgi:hypothetical protein